MQTLIWFTKGKQSTSNELVRYYKNLGFHPTLPMNYCLCHVLPTTLVEKLNQQTNDPQNKDVEFILETKPKIEKIQNEIQLNNYRTIEDLIPKCEVCGIDIKYKDAMILCKYQLKGSMRAFTHSFPKKSVCGVILCYTCQSNFGCEDLDRCPFHHKVIKSRTEKLK